MDESGKYLSGERMSLKELVKYISLRPVAFIGSSDIRAVAAFVDGFAYGNEATYRELRAFSKWLAQRIDFPDNWAWWSGLQARYPDKEEFCALLPLFYTEFLDSVGEKQSEEDC